MKIPIGDILIEDRQRKELGSIDELANSIREYGILQKIVLSPEPNQKGRLVIGERRLRALIRIGVKELEYGEHFIWLSEMNQDPLRRAAVELEENLRRKELTWQEEIEAKQKLMETMQLLHGAPKLGQPKVHEKGTSTGSGFGVNKLASMLGESNFKTSTDLELARAMKVMPSLGGMSSKTSALRQARVFVSIAQMSGIGQPKPVPVPGEVSKEVLWTLHEGSFADLSTIVPNESVDLVYTDLPYGVNLNEGTKHNTGIEYQDDLLTITDLLSTVSSESFRVLKPNRFAVFFFGFRYYSELLEQLRYFGFSIDPMPFIWYKSTRASEQPHMMYARAYDAAMVARKGSPIFIRQGQQNLITLPPISTTERLQIAQQPVELVEKFIKDMTTSGATVVDWMAGSGTTGVAAVKNGCKVIMFEKEKLCQEAIKARMSSMK